MKKIFTLVALAMTAMSMNAQLIHTSQFVEAQGITAEYGSDFAANVEIGSIDGKVSLYNAATSPYKAVDCKNNDYDMVVIDGVECATANGIQGNGNPNSAAGQNPWNATVDVPVTGGSVFKASVAADGYLYVIHKISTNKQYGVCENGSPMGYKVLMENSAGVNNVLALEVKGEGEYNYWNTANTIPWLIRMYKNDPEAATAGNGLGVMFFPVFNGCDYVFSAGGSKISLCGVYYSATEASSIKVVNSTTGTQLDLSGATFVEYPSGSSAVAGVAEAKSEAKKAVKVITANGIQIGNYNIAGQQVK